MENADMLTEQYKERAVRLGGELKGLLERKNGERRIVLEAGLSEEDMSAQLAELDAKFSRAQRELEVEALRELEPTHLRQQLEMRQRQLREVAATVRQLAPEDAVKRLQQLDAERQEQEMEELQKQMQKEKEERLKKIEEEKRAFEEELRAKHEADMARLAAEEERLLERERATQEARMKEKEAELEAEQARLEAAAKKRGEALNTEESEKLTAQFKEDQKKVMERLKAEGKQQHNKLEEKLRARREKKKRDLEAKKEQEMQRKTEREEEALQRYEESVNTAAVMAQEAQAKALVDSGAAEGVKLEVDAEGLRLAREGTLTGDAVEAKEKLRAVVSKKKLARMGSVLSIGEEGKGFSRQLPEKVAEQQYADITSKLGDIEKVLGTLQQTQQRQAQLAQSLEAQQRDLDKAHAAPGVYRDPEDAAVIPQGDQLVSLAREDLPQHALSRLEFGERLLPSLGLRDVTVHVASNLPPVLDPSGTNTNAFRNSYMWDPAGRKLHVHARRLSSSGDFGLVMVHAAAHIRLNPQDITNDLDPEFAKHFHHAMKVMTAELFKRRSQHSTNEPPGSSGQTEAAAAAGSSALAPRASSVEHDAGATGEPAASGFTDDALAERVKRYAAASGHPHISKFMSRYTAERGGRDKFALSEDEDEEDEEEIGEGGEEKAPLN
ncbi:unnamed protein product [Chrysoparadoxa australica]